ncbi:hypothetical protein IFM89_016149 [Coptis chinensis]|uniref:Uncharacterized protein n=1 Tax=Coptis chinensis TaxID=261450 RepID=A0A835LRT4_9MAGN|nr:hypothetical protein IFM89_016149 [Coptis chinensis]
MNLSDEVDLEDYVSRPDKINVAEITTICQEAGMHAVHKNRYVILPKDFEKGYRTNALAQCKISLNKLAVVKESVDDTAGAA